MQLKGTGFRLYADLPSGQADYCTGQRGAGIITV